MRDRQPTKVLENGALRYGVYDETGALLRYEYLALEDAPSDVGTDLSKANLLTDDTETALFGSAADRTVNDAFAGIAGQLKLIKDDVASITLTLKDSAGTAIPGVLVQGILSDSGQAVYSNSSGVVSGYIPEGSQTIKVTGYADIVDYSETISVTKGTSITKTITLTTRNFLKITSSQSVKFSGNVNTVDETVVGGGGGGQGGYATSSTMRAGSGGWAGSVVTESGIDITPNSPYSAVVGAGGTQGNYSGGNGGDGGSSSFLGVTATGGTGGSTTNNGSGNAKGGLGRTSDGNGNAGNNGTNTVFVSFSSVETGPGGGGGGALHSSGSGGSPDGGAGGSKNGANGGGIHMNGYGVEPSPAPDNSGAGGGGGPAASWDNSGRTNYGAEKGSKGGSGFIAIRMHLKSAA